MKYLAIKPDIFIPADGKHKIMSPYNSKYYYWADLFEGTSETFIVPVN